MRHRAYWLIGATTLFALVFSGTAWGKCGRTIRKGNPAVIQYVEPIRLSCGSEAAGSGSSGGSSVKVKLPSGIASRLHGTSGAELKNIATNPALGAQPRNLRGDVSVRGGGNLFSASLGALGGGSGERVVILLSLMGGAAA